jgi:hypothetical protein
MEGWARWIGVILVVLALARAAALVAHDPVAAYPGAEQPTPACCSWNAEGALAGVVSSIAHIGQPTLERFPLRALGFAKLALLFATALTVAALLMNRPAASIAHGLAVLLLLADPVVTLWANSLHREFLEIWAIYATICAACLLASTDHSVVPWSLLFVAVIVLAFTRQHEAILGLALVAVAWSWLWHRSQRLAAAAGVLSLVLSVVAIAVLSHEGVLVRPDPDPAALAKAIGAMQHAGPKAPLLPAWDFSLVEMSTHAMPAAAFAALQVATFLLLPLALVTLLVLRRWRGDPLAPLLLAAALGAVATHAAVVAIFGGAPDPAARYLPAILAMYAAIIAALVGLPVLVRRWIGGWRDMPLELGVGAAMLGAGAYACLLLVRQ